MPIGFPFRRAVLRRQEQLAGEFGDAADAPGQIVVLRARRERQNGKHQRGKPGDPHATPTRSDRDRGAGAQDESAEPHGRTSFDAAINGRRRRLR